MADIQLIQCKKQKLTENALKLPKLEMGKNPHCLGSVLFGFYDCQGSGSVGVLGSVCFSSVYEIPINVFLQLLMVMETT